MTTQAQKEKVQEALCWSNLIGCCSDKERYALRIWDLFDELGISREVPDAVIEALKDLLNWEECQPACLTVDNYLRELLKMDDGAWERLTSSGRDRLAWIFQARRA